MTDDAIQGTCEECGKVYKVPSADRTYRCKACGGVVSVLDDDDFDDDYEDEEDYEEEDYEDEEEYEDDEYDDEDDEADDEAPRYRKGRGAPRDRRSGRGRGDDEADEDEHRHRASDRLRHHSGSRESNKAIWITMGAVLVLGAVALVLHGLNLAPWSDKGEIDLEVVNREFSEDWADGSIGSLVEYRHPQAQTLFKEKLREIADLWGWDGGFPPITGQTCHVEKNSQGDPIKGDSTLKFGDDKQLSILWQYEKGRNKWYIYNFETSLPPVDKRVEELKTLWAKSSPDMLRPLCTNDSVGELLERVKRGTDKLGWTGKYPPLGTYTVSPPDDKGRVNATFNTPDGEFTVRFMFSQEKYTWYIASFIWP